MSVPSDRRGFLRSLVSLPLIGGGVTLIGQPSASAVPITRNLLAEYVEWLGHERSRASNEYCSDLSRQFYKWEGPSYEWHKADIRAGILPSTRAAVVLSAVGVDWRAGR